MNLKAKVSELAESDRISNQHCCKSTHWWLSFLMMFDLIEIIERIAKWIKWNKANHMEAKLPSLRIIECKYKKPKQPLPSIKAFLFEGGVKIRMMGRRRVLWLFAIQFATRGCLLYLHCLYLIATTTPHAHSNWPLILYSILVCSSRQLISICKHILDACALVLDY